MLWAEVLWVDRFGNLQLNIDPEEVAPYGEAVGLLVGTSVHDATARTAARVHAYDDLATGELGLVVDSYGLLSIAQARASAADELRLGPGDSVGLRPLEDADDDSDGREGRVARPVTTSVTLGRRRLRPTDRPTTIRPPT